MIVDPNRTPQNLTFSGATASAYVIGTTGGSTLLLTNGGTIQTTATIANTETVNAPLVLAPATATTAGTYTFSSNATAIGNVLNIGGALTLGATSAADTLNVGGTNTGANTLSGTVSDTGTGGLVLNKSGVGSWTFGGNGTSTLVKGNITVNGGTLNFGSATDTPTLNITGSAGSNVGVFVISGNLNMNAGALAVTSSQGLVLNGTNTYTQTGGTFTTPTLNMTTSQINGGATSAAKSTYSLNGGGTLVTGTVIKGTGGSTGTQTFNFNGGTLQSSASKTTFMQGLTMANVQAGGAVINTNGFTDTIGQTLVHDMTSGAAATDGGLTKNGAGTLILLGTNTYTGSTTVTTGTLSGNTASYGTRAVTVASGATVDYTQSATTGTAANKISGSGTATFGGVTANNANGTGGTINYTGQDSTTQTNVQSGTVTLNRTGGSALTGPVTIATNANVTLGSDTQIATTAPGTANPATVALNGGTLNANGHSDGTVSGTPSSDPTTSAVTSNMGTLSLASEASTLDFGVGSTNSIFAFADSLSSLSTGNGTLNVINYTGGTDALYISTTKNLTQSELSRITFAGMSGTTQLSNGQLAAAPAPSEYASFAIGLLGLGGLALRAKKRKEAAQAA